MDDNSGKVATRANLRWLDQMTVTAIRTYRSESHLDREAWNKWMRQRLEMILRIVENNNS